MLTVMMPAELVRDARSRAGLSVRELSALAGVSASTVSRIERGHMDPTFGMLERLLNSAGRDLKLTTRAALTPRLASLATAWEPSARGDLVDWTRLRALLDHLALHPADTASAIRIAPARSGSPLLDNILAGIAETLADEAGLPRPSWTRDIEALPRKWSTPGTERIRHAARRTTPQALASRGITLARTSLWRERSGAR
jgi:transcriptional regulator with XRE-family HTH domain